MQKSAIKNGNIIREEDALVPVTVREVQSNFSVYEALRVVNRHVVHLDDHIKRLKSSASQIGLVLPSVPWQEWIDRLIEKDSLEDATMRILVYGGSECMVFITWQPLITYPDSYYSEGVAVTTYYGERYLPTCKTSNLLLSYLALNDAKNKGAFEALLVDRHNQVLEGTRSNFYVLMGGTMFTAPDDEVLSGVTRISVLRAAKELGIDVVMRAVRLEELENAGSMFISSTSMAAMPVSRLDGKAVPCDFPTILKIRDLVRKWEVE